MATAISSWARALAGGYREKVKVVSKIPPGKVNSEEEFFRILDGMLEKLQTDHLDVLLAHNLGKESFAQLKKINMVSMMEKAKAQGKDQGHCLFVPRRF